tara:strand:+ start:1044 stop:1334 length:291 start_codon:yes stop_codon:yes gene_type:complete
MNKKKKKLEGTIENYPFVEVKWLDTLADNSWMTIEKAKKLKPQICFSKGHKLIQTKELITIFADYSIDADDKSLTVGNTNTIPGAWIQEVTEIVIK